MKINEHTFNHRRRENIVEACTALPFSRNITYIYIHTCRRLLTIVGEHASLKRYHSQLDISLFQRLLNIIWGKYIEEVNILFLIFGNPRTNAFVET